MTKLAVSAVWCVGLIAVVISGPAKASVVYDLTLTATSDQGGSAPLSTYNGTGTITLDYAPSSNGETDYGQNTLEAVSFSIDGQTFTGYAKSVSFLDGNFRNASFSEQVTDQVNQMTIRFSLMTTSDYAFAYDNELENAYGTITASPAPAATPLPAALPMFAGGLGFVGFLVRRRKRNSRSHLAAA